MRGIDFLDAIYYPQRENKNFQTAIERHFTRFPHESSKGSTSKISSREWNPMSVNEKENLFSVNEGKSCDTYVTAGAKSD